jgi:hypothetical protein
MRTRLAQNYLGQLWPIFLIIGGITLLIPRSWRG